MTLLTLINNLKRINFNMIFNNKEVWEYKLDHNYNYFIVCI